MQEWKIFLDVTTVYETTVEADTREEAIEKATTEAYEDTWGCDARYDNAEVYTAEKVAKEWVIR